MPELSLEYWYLFPIAIGIATLAMSSGIGGAVFFSPIFLLWLKLEPTVAVGTALLTELFGFTSGLIAYIRSRQIDYKLALNLLMFSVPAAIVGVLVADEFPPVVLKAIFATGLVFLGYQMFASWRQEDKVEHDSAIANASEAGERRIEDRDGNVYEYSIRRKAMGRVFAAVGGVFLGMISVGLAELEEYHLVVKCRVPSPVAIATSIFVVVGTVLVAVIGHGYAFVSESSSAAISQVLNVAVFTVPGVLIGGQLGPKLGTRLNPDVMKVGVSILFVMVGAFMLLTLVL